MSAENYLIKSTESPNSEASAELHVSKAIERFEWRENKTEIVKINGNKLREFYDEFNELKKKIAKIKSVLKK